MLKLERASKSGEINVRLRTRERFFNPVFCLALGLAVSLHLFAIIIFHISPFKIESQWIFPSVKVNSELGLQPDSDTFILAQMEENKLLTPAFQPPPRSISVLPAYTENSLSKKFKSDKSQEYAQVINTFDLRMLPLTHFSPNLLLTYDSFAITVSGRLAETELLEQMIPTKVQSQSPPIKKVHVRFDVRVDEKNGRIFWVRRIESSKRNDLDQQSEQILKSLHFKNDPKNVETEGEVEITFAI